MRERERRESAREIQSESERERERVCVRVCVCVCDRERERVRESGREGRRDRKRERERAYPASHPRSHPPPVTYRGVGQDSGSARCGARRFRRPPPARYKLYSAGPCPGCEPKQVLIPRDNSLRALGTRCRETTGYEPFDLDASASTSSRNQSTPITSFSQIRSDPATHHQWTS